MDGSVERFIAGLEARFEALLARDEETAADDLAGSIDRGTVLHERLRAEGRALSVLTPGGGRAQASTLGRDHLGCGSPVILVAALAWAVLAEEPGDPPAVTDVTMSQALRPWAEGRRGVEVSSLGEASYAGNLVLVASDHLILERAGTRLLIPSERVASVRLFPEG